MVRIPTSGDEHLAVFGKNDYGITFSHDKSNL